MGRPNRILIDNGMYHVMARGNQKQKVFIQEGDFLKFLELLKHYKNKYSFKLYAYCLMPNHIHLILQVKAGNSLSKVMQGLNQTYTAWFNEKYNKVGHLWQGRYKCRIIQEDEYMLECLQYVESNPLRAGLCKALTEYPFTSWEERAGYTENKLLDKPDWA